MKNKPYRQAVNCIIKNINNHFLIIQLQEYSDNQWKFVGGGIEDNESIIEAAYREIEEETSISKNDLQLLGESSVIQQYDFPKEMNKEITKKFKGQRKYQFIFTFVGNVNDIKIQEEEIKNFQWVSKEKLGDYLLFPGQIDNFNKIIDEFSL